MDSLILFLVIIYVIACLLLIFVVLMQGGKSEGLFTSTQANVLGGRGTDVLTKTTTVLATVFFIGALVISFLISMEKSATDAQFEASGLGSDEATQIAPATEDTETNSTLPIETQEGQ